MSTRHRDSTRRRKEDDRERDSPKSKLDRHRSSRSSRKVSSSSTKSRDRDRDRDRDRPHTSHSISRSSRKVSGGIPEMDQRASTTPPSASRSSLPYPSFSKAHSKEAIGSRDDIANPRLSLYTPDPTDLGSGGDSKHDKSDGGETPTATQGAAPPSPPLTAAEHELRRPESDSSIGKRRTKTGPIHSGHSTRRSSLDTGRLSSTPGRRPKTSNSKSSLRKTLRVGEKKSYVTSTSKSSSPAPTVQEVHIVPVEKRSISPNARPQGRTASTGSYRTSTITQSVTDSDTTFIAPAPAPKKVSPKSSTVSTNIDDSPISVVDSSPRTPTQKVPQFPSLQSDGKEPPMVEIFTDDLVFTSAEPISAGLNALSPPPPPPPPPPPVMNPADIPRVDYLLQNGGLPQAVPKSFSSAPQNPVIQSYQQYASPRPQPPASSGVYSIFTPFQKLLDDYSQVLSKNGSVAVATGYRSVARRLLDRLEAVFARNISSETCRCVMCRTNPPSNSTEEDTGVSWGEILEYVSGRREHPPWPPFTITTTDALGISGAEQEPPMQKLDIDVPEEYREHYVRQSKKTKQAVQKWLALQPELPSSPPQEADDETLTFAMLTHLEPERRPTFTALLKGLATIPVSRAPTPMGQPKSEFLNKTSIALRRLYRLANPPRDPECAMYLLNNPDLHSVLATLAAVSNQEWEILVSGRFDGFLWSGAEDMYPPSNFSPPSRAPSRGPTATPLSRTTTPFSAAGPSRAPSRGSTPFSPGQARGATPTPSSFGAPVQVDEETEIAVLAEVEREIYAGMEALEDAFEMLHQKAEGVRRALRERSAGLAMAAQARRGAGAEEIQVRMGTPASINGGWIGAPTWELETDDGLDDERSELAPDDSASNISYNRRRRPQRRTERMTPAPVEEEEEDESEMTDQTPRKAQ